MMTMDAAMRRGRAGLVALALGLASPPLGAAGAQGDAKVLQAVLPAEACCAAFLAPKPGQAFHYQLWAAPDLQDHWFLVLKLGDRRVLLELRQAGKAAPEVVERRAWMLRNRQRRLLTEVDGFKACDTRFGVPLERLEEALDHAETAGSWKRSKWPKAPAKASKKTEKRK